MPQVSATSPNQYSKKEAEAASTIGSLRLLGGYTMCPNWIYDSLLVNESPSVIKVVMYFNRNTTGRTGQDGQRVETVQASYGWIARKMEMSLRAVGDAMRTALAKGFLIMVKPPRVATDKALGEGGCYSLNWNWPDFPASKTETETPEKSLLATTSDQQKQNLPGGLEQNLLPCRNKTDSEPNKVIEIRLPACEQPTQISSTEVSLSMPGKTKNARRTQENSASRKGSGAIGRLIADLTREFGDNPELLLPNIGRSLNLWQKSGVNETEFIGLIYQARQKTKASGATVRHQRLEAGSEKPSDLPNRMPYFFGVLADLIVGSGTEGKASNSMAQTSHLLSRLQTARPDRLEPADNIGPKLAILAGEVASEPQKGERTYHEGQLSELWRKVCRALEERYHAGQLATKAANAQLKIDVAKRQILVSFNSCPWVLNSLLSSERALLQMAISQEIGKGFALKLLDKFLE